MLGLTKIVIHGRELVAQFGFHVYEKNAADFPDWISSLMEKANLEFTFIQEEKSLKIRLLINTSPKNKLKYAKKFLQSLL